MSDYLFSYYMCHTTAKKQEKHRKYNKSTVNKSHNVVHKQLTIVCTSDFKNQLSIKTEPSLINIHSNINSECLYLNSAHRNLQCQLRIALLSDILCYY